MGSEERKEMLCGTKAEYQKFADAMMDKPVSFYAFEMLYWCGIREGELLALTPADFDFEAGTVKISDRVMRSLIEGYTREAGVRTLERTIAKVIRKAAVTMLDEGETDVTVTEKVLHQYLGAPRFTRELPEKKPRVGIVGEILVKYMPVANNHLVDLLEEEGAEAVVPDLMDFMNYSVYNGKFKHEYLGKGWTSEASAVLGVKGIRALRRPALKALEKSKRFEPPMHIEQIAELSDPFLSQGNQYGEGWFLTGEMAELLLTGVPNIVCIQPFACLPNHVVGKGVIKQLRQKYPQANICAVDFDPGASEVNQLNRVKLMLSAARKTSGQEAT